MTKKAIIFVQSQLNANGLNAGPEDGILGPGTLSALNNVEGIPADWSKTRKAVGFIQLLATENNIEAGAIDGFWGPQTEYAFEVLERVLIEDMEPEIWRPEELLVENPNNWPVQTPEEKLIEFYGEVNENQISVDLPYPHRFSWDKSTVVNRFTCHEKVQTSLQKVLSGVLDHYGLEEIKRLRLDLWGGCLNVRKMRGGTRYSMHSWGIALDYDPEKNKLKWVL